MTFKNDYSVIDFDDLKIRVIEGVQSFLECFSSLEYSTLPNIVGCEVLHSLVLNKKDSQFLIQLLEESSLFLLNDGKISKQHESDEILEFVQDSNISDKACQENTKNDGLEISLNFENARNSCVEDEQISYNGLKTSFCKNNDYEDAKVEEICHEDLKTIPKNIDTEHKISNKNFSTEDSTVILFTQRELSNQYKQKNYDENIVQNDDNLSDLNLKIDNISPATILDEEDSVQKKNKLLEQQRDGQNVLNFENKSMNILTLSTLTEDDDMTNKENHVHKNSNSSETLLIEQAVSNLETGECAIILDEQLNVSGSHCNIHKVVEVNEENVLENSEQINVITDRNNALKSENGLQANSAFSKSPTLRKDSLESDSENDRPQQSFESSAMQALRAKIIVLTLDSCIAETVIGNQKRCLFCLKSCFHCDLHTNCANCFNSLTVGSKIVCYIPNAVDLTCDNMCFSFMFHKEVGMMGNSVRSLSIEIPPEKKSNLTLELKHSSSENCKTTFHRDQYNQLSSEECQTVHACETKIHSSAVEKECQAQSHFTSKSTQVQSIVMSQSTQVQPPIVSRNIQTYESSTKKYCGIDKECQATRTSVSQITQTGNRTFEVECQTVLVGEVKSSPPLCDKACLTKFPSVSQNTQTASETFEFGSQTSNSDDNIPLHDTTSSECQTILTGQVQKCSSFTEKFCETFSKPISKTTQTEVDMRTQEESDVKGESLTFLNIPCGVDTGARSKHSFLVAQKTFCDIPCQTLSTGPIMMKKIYQIE